MATDITYNTVTIHNCVTREFDQELLYDPSSTDLVAIRYKLGVEGHIHAQSSIIGSPPIVPPAIHGIQSTDVQATPGFPVNLGFSLATVQQFDRVSQLLTQPRGNFLMAWGGNTILQATPAGVPITGANMDVDNGPKPRGMSVISVTPASIRVRWSVEFMLSNCPGDILTPLLRKGAFKVINNRWSIAEGRDADFFTQRRITGTIRFAEGLTPKHAFIGVITPGLEKGFKRESIEYEQQPNQLECTYAVVDRQVHYAAPWPATDMSVSHSLSTNDALTWMDDVNVTLKGSPEADRRLLIQRMIQILDARCDFLKTVDASDKQYLIENVVITENLSQENSVTANVTVRNMANDTRQVLGNILDKHLGKPLELPVLEGQAYDRTISRVPALQGYDPHGGERDPAFLFLLQCYWQDPCGTVKSIFAGTIPSDSPGDQTQKTESPYPTPVTAVTDSPGSLTNYDSSTFSAAYTIARMSSRYVGNKLRVMLPIATANGSGDTAEAADLAAGTALRIIHYEAERLGDWPSIPDLPDTYSSGAISGKLLKYMVEPLPPALSADGQKKIFRVLAKACYGLNKMPTTEDLAVGRLPYTTLSDSDKVFPLGTKRLNTIGP